MLAGDTLFAATEVRSKRQINEWLGEVELRVVGVKNERPEALLAAGKDLFESERRKDKSDRLRNKVVEITRRALVMLK